MRQPPSFSPRRPFARPTGVPRSEVAAAAALLGTAFERQRHRREHARLSRQLVRVETALAEEDLRTARLCSVLLGTDGDGEAS